MGPKGGKTLNTDSFNDFVRTIEAYYLNLKGEGIMLSPKEYDLIVNWRAQSVPKEIVIMGIRKAVEKGIADDRGRKRELRSLTQCAAYVEELIREYKSSRQSDLNEISHGNKDAVNLVLEKLNRIIQSERRDVVRKHYTTSKKRVLQLLEDDQSDTFRGLRQIEEDFFEDFFQSIPEEDKKRIMREAAMIVNRRERFMTKRAQSESLNSFRNELLIKEFKLINFNAMDR